MLVPELDRLVHTPTSSSATGLRCRYVGGAVLTLKLVNLCFKATISAAHLLRRRASANGLCPVLMVVEVISSLVIYNRPSFREGLGALRALSHSMVHFQVGNQLSGNSSNFRR